ncbi:MAG: hypothetical protein U0531_07965 [Dehalococcoidia bacterium]
MAALLTLSVGGAARAQPAADDGVAALTLFIDTVRGYDVTTIRRTFPEYNQGVRAGLRRRRAHSARHAGPAGAFHRAERAHPRRTPARHRPRDHGLGGGDGLVAQRGGRAGHRLPDAGLGDVVRRRR